MPVIRITDESWERLKKWAVPLEDSPDDAVRKVLDVAEEHLKCPGQSTLEIDTKVKGVRSFKNGRLQRGVKVGQGEYRRPILEALNRQGGSASVDMVLQYIEEKMKHRFTDVDYELIPSGGSIRWQNTAEWERFALVKEGLLEPSSNSPRGVWILTDKGREFLNEGTE
jgi:hypothetical protein